ncbi:MAG: SRPBCC domain-containing protein [Anaerolineae bacterium]
MQKVETMQVERSIWINASRERVWKALIDPEQLAQWFLPPMLGAQMKRDENGTIYVSLGAMEVPIAVLEAVEQPRKIISRSLPDKLLKTTYTLEEENGGTRVMVLLSGFDALNEQSAQERLAPSGAVWEKALNNLQAYVDGAELPYPEGYTAALFGYRRETKEKYAIERSVWIDAPRERVWKAITDPQEYQRWYSPSTIWKLSALEVGGKLYVYDVSTESEMYVQIIEIVDPPHRFASRSTANLSEVPLVTTYTLEEEMGGTRVFLTHAGYEVESDASRHQNMEQNAFGFGLALDNLKAYSEGKEPPNPFGF